MNNRQKVEALRKQGYTVKYTARKDGSIRITSIVKGKKSLYKGKANSSQGNNQANKLLGLKTNEKLLAQRRTAGEVARKVNLSRRARKPSGDIKKEVRYYQAVLRKIRKARGMTPEQIKKAGRVSMKEFREYSQRFGIERARQAARNTTIHLAGYAYPSQIEAYIEAARPSQSVLPPMGMEFFNRIVSSLQIFVQGYVYMFDDDLQSIYHYLYEILKPSNPKDVKVAAMDMTIKVIEKNKSNNFAI